MSKILISGYYGFSNAGDEALLTAILASLYAIEPEADITVISGNPSDTTAKHRVKSIFRFDAGKILSAMGQADLLLSGGGSLLQDVTSKRSLAYYLSMIALAKLRGKKVMLFAQGIGPIRNGFMRLLTRFICRRADVITVRDRDSAEELVRLGLEREKIEVTADSVLTLAPVSKDAGRQILKKAGLVLTEPIIGVSVRSWPENRRCLQQLAAGLARISRRYDAQVIVLPLQYPMDVEASKAVRNFIPPLAQKVVLLEEAYPTEVFLSLIGNFNLLVGMRLHALIFAAVMDVPFLAISYDPKVDSFVRAVGSEPVGTVENLLAEKVVEAACALWGKIPVVQKERIATMRALALSNAEKAFALLGDKNKK